MELPQIETSLSVKGWWQGGSGQEEVKPVPMMTGGVLSLYFTVVIQGKYFSVNLQHSFFPSFDMWMLIICLEFFLTQAAKP